MRPGRREAAIGILVLSAATMFLGQVAILVLAPAIDTGLPLLQAYRRIESAGYYGSTIVFTGLWLVWSCLCVGFVILRLSGSPAWERTGRHRHVSLIGLSLMAFGLVATGTWFPFTQIHLALFYSYEFEPEHRPPALISEAFFGSLWWSGAAAILAALVLGAVGGVIDRIRGMAPLVDPAALPSR